MAGITSLASETRTIAHDQIKPTLDAFARVAGISPSSLTVVGESDGRELSRVVVGLDRDAFSPTRFAQIVRAAREAYGEDHWSYRSQFRTHVFSVPIEGDPGRGRAQIDLKRNDLELLRFGYPTTHDGRGAYLGAVRSVMLATLAASIIVPGRDVQHREGDDIVAEARWSFTPHEGLKRIFKIRPFRIDRTARKREFENVSPADFKAQFPDPPFDAQERTLKNPRRIVSALFGRGVRLEDIETVSGLVAAMRKKHAGLMSSGLLERLRRNLERAGLAVPPDLDVTPAPVINTEWREFRKKSGKRTHVWSIAMEPDGESFKLRQGYVGGEILELGPNRPGERGRPGSPTYVSARDACIREVERRIQLRITGGFGELIDGEVVEVEAARVDFSKPFPRNVVTPKPQEVMPKGEFERLHGAGLARVTRKYDGVGLVVVRHTYGWECYSIHGNRMTDFFPNHVAELNATDFKAGTVLKAEAILFRSDEPTKDDFSRVNGLLDPRRDPIDVRWQIDSKAAPEPSMVIYDILYRDGVELSTMTYDDRSAMWRGFPVARSGNGLLQAAELLTDITPDNWEQRRVEMEIEGFVVVDGSSVIGCDVLSYASAPPRPKGNYKLKPFMEEDVVVYAVRQVDGVYESVFTKQRYPATYPGTDRPHPRAGEWFYCGRVSLLNMKDVIAKIGEVADQGLIHVVPDNKTGEAIPVDNEYGVTATIELFDRYASNKFRHPAFVRPVRFRHEGADFKPTTECTAHYLGERPRKIEADA